MSKYIYSVMDIGGDIIDEEQFATKQECIKHLQTELVLDEHEEIIDGDIEAVFFYKVPDDFQHGVDELTDEYEVYRLTSY